MIIMVMDELKHGYKSNTHQKLYQIYSKGIIILIKLIKIMELTEINWSQNS